MMLNRTKQNSLLFIVKQLQPLQKRRNCTPAAAWVTTTCGSNPFCPLFFTPSCSPIGINHSLPNDTHRCTHRDFTTCTAIPELGGKDGKSVSKVVTLKYGGNSSLAVTVERLERRTVEVLSKIDSARQQQQRQKKKNQEVSPILPPSLRSQICTIIQSWGSLWGKSNVSDPSSTGNVTTKDFIPEYYIQRGVKASNQLLEAILQDDLRICRSGGKSPSLLISQVEKNVLLSCASIVINGWARSGFLDSGWRAKSILEMMEELFENGNNFYKPYLYTYNGVINAFIKTMKRDSKRCVQNKKRKSKEVYPISTIPEEIERILERMESYASLGRNPDALPNNISYNMLITALSRSRDPLAGEKCEQILNRMQQLYEESPARVDVQPDEFTYASVLDAWYKIANDDGTHDDVAANRALSLLKRMNDLCRLRGDDTGLSSKHTAVKLNSVVVSTVISALTSTALKIKEKNKDLEMAQRVAQRARALLEWQIQSYLHGNADLKPQLIIYNRVLDAIAKTSGPQAAEELLGRLEHLHQTGTGMDGPDVYSYTTVITAWSKQHDRLSADRADAILQRMESLYLDGVIEAKPNNYTYNAVIIAYSRNRHGIASAEKAEKLLERMQVLASSEAVEGKEPTNTRDDLRPDKITFSSVMAAWMKSNAPAILSLSKVESLHQKMEDLYLAGNERCKPDLVSFSTLIGALAKSEVEDAPQRAEVVFQRMKNFDGGIRPNLYTYNSLIHAWVNSKQPDAIQKAEAIYEEMMKLSSGENGDLDAKPDHITYSTLLDGFSKRYKQKEMVNRAESMLEQLISHYRSGASDVKPSSYAFNSVVTMYARLGKVDDAARILHRMKTLNADGTLPDVTPTIVTYNAIIVGCSAVSTEDERERRKILSFASYLLNEIEHSKSVEADSYTYGELFTVCHNMITDEEERTKSFLDLFHRCCRSGQLNNFVISRFLAADAPSGTVFKEVLGPYIDEKSFVDISKLPKDWCRNAQLLSRFVGTK